RVPMGRRQGRVQGRSGVLHLIIDSANRFQRQKATATDPGGGTQNDFGRVRITALLNQVSFTRNAEICL
ncbi:hypothetical protein, partial [Burkholderia multivorans]|uniref:hypothetical protein n=1 Tax=Burkholderia multivorans TaxID=87883 RepID=UPI001C613AE5